MNKGNDTIVEPITRWPGYMAIVWHKGQIVQVLWGRDRIAAEEDADEWRRLFIRGEVEN